MSYVPIGQSWKDTPLRGLLTRMQTATGWLSDITPEMRSNVAMRLYDLATDQDQMPQVSVQAASCLMRASSLEVEAINSAAKLHEQHILSEKLDALAAKLDQSNANTVQAVTINIPDDYDH